MMYERKTRLTIFMGLEPGASVSRVKYLSVTEWRDRHMTFFRSRFLLLQNKEVQRVVFTVN